MEKNIYFEQAATPSSMTGAFSQKYFFKSLNDSAKRGVDMFASLLGLILLLPLFLVIGILIKKDSPGPILYRGKRAGRGGGTFGILKFRTMYERQASYEGSKVTAVNDNRITPLGRWLRDTKINELPQLWNVLIGDMSLVGPRPEDPDIAATWSTEARKEILSVRPGITSPASVIYRHEEKLLNTKDVMTTYLKTILPSKIRLDQLYVRNRSFWLDIDVIIWTLLVLWPGLGEYQPPENYLFWGPVYRLASRYVNWFLVDTLITVFAFSFIGMQSGWSGLIGNQIGVIVTFALLFSLVGVLTGINKISWSKAVSADVFDLIPAMIIATFGAILINSRLKLLPFGLILVASLVTFGGFVLARYRNQLLGGLVSRILDLRSGALSAREKVLVIGSGQTGQFAARVLSQKEGAGAYHVIGFVDDDYYKTGERIRGMQVLGSRKDISALVERYDVGVIIFAIHKIDLKDRDEILENCHRTKASVYLLPDFLGALQNITSIPMNQKKSSDERSSMVDLANRDGGSLFAETVHDRNSFLRAAEKVFQASQQTASHLTAIMMEINPLEQFLGETGYATADQFLLNVAAQCQRVLRNIDLIGLYDGQKLAILLNDHKPIPVHIITNRLSSYINQYCLEGGENKVRGMLNIGVASRDEDTSTFISLLNQAVADLMVSRQPGETLPNDLEKDLFQKNIYSGGLINS